MGGQCPGALELKGPPGERQKKKKKKKNKKKKAEQECVGAGQRNKVIKYWGGAPESLLSMGPERPRYATGLAPSLGELSVLLIM